MATLRKPKMLGSDFVELVCNALGLTSMAIRSVTIHADVTSGVKVAIEQFALPDEGARIADELAAYDVIPQIIEIKVKR